MATLTGHFAVVDHGDWSASVLIQSSVEGTFFERFSVGSFQRTLQQGRAIKHLLEHGRDPQVGNRPLGVVDELEEDSVGARYSTTLFDSTEAVKGLLPALSAGLYRMSFRFRSVEERYVPRPPPSARNPSGIPERTVLEASVAEISSVLFPAYGKTTATLRSAGGHPIPAGRVETVKNLRYEPRSLPALHSNEPATIRQLRTAAKHSKGAARLLDDVERGRPVLIRWDDLDGALTRDRPLFGPKRSWRLETSPKRRTHSLTTAMAPSWRL
jgi:HK97 family phage prohead protease